MKGILDWFKEKEQLIDENMKIRKGKFDIEQRYNTMLNDMEIIQQKYIDLLEKKSEQFNLYIKYQNQCDDLAKEKRELKKHLAETNELCNSLTDSNNNLTKQVERLERKIKRLENENGKTA